MPDFNTALSSARIAVGQFLRRIMSPVAGGADDQQGGHGPSETRPIPRREEGRPVVGLLSVVSPPPGEAAVPEETPPEAEERLQSDPSDAELMATLRRRSPSILRRQLETAYGDVVSEPVPRPFDNMLEKLKDGEGANR